MGFNIGFCIQYISLFYFFKIRVLSLGDLSFWPLASYPENLTTVCFCFWNFKCLPWKNILSDLDSLFCQIFWSGPSHLIYANIWNNRPPDSYILYVFIYQFLWNILFTVNCAVFLVQIYWFGKDTIIKFVLDILWVTCITTTRLYWHECNTFLCYNYTHTDIKMHLIHFKILDNKVIHIVHCSSSFFNFFILCIRVRHNVFNLRRDWTNAVAGVVRVDIWRCGGSCG